MPTTAIVWLRRDLRVHDHPALRAALAAADAVVPVFCLDDRLLHGRHASGPRTQFLLESLEDLAGELGSRGGALVVRRGPPHEELPKLAEATGATSVHFTADVSPYARGVENAVRATGLDLRPHPGVTVVDDVREITTRQGEPYSVFSPFERTWRAQPRRDPLAAPRSLPPLPDALEPGAIPTLAALGLEQSVERPMRGGETAARRRLKNWLAGPVHRYVRTHDALGEDGTSRLSPYLHLGCVSPREVERRLPRGEGPDAFRRQLAWRDFYHHVLLHNPQNAHHEHQPRYRNGALGWDHDEEALDAWREGRTGFPLVDAGMRQLRHEGWMHNRARLVVASFLTKDLGLDWRLGERHFMSLLIDGDEANNNGNWQWIASVGVDPQPFYRRIYNPARHMERYDPDGRYVRRWVPELRDVPGEHLAEPWKMPDDLQERAGCVVGRDYPAPIVDHRSARAAALERYRAAAAAG